MDTSSPLAEDQTGQQLGACVALQNPSGQILLGKRKNAYKAGMYGLPGGRVEVNEPLQEAALREVLEETGIELTSLEYIGVVRENQGSYDFIHFIYSGFTTTAIPKLMEPEKCEGWEWFDLENLPSTILPGHAAALKLLIEKKHITDLTQ